MESIIRLISNFTILFALAAILFFLFSLLGKLNNQHLSFDLDSKERRWAAALGILFCLLSLLPQILSLLSEPDNAPVGTVVAYWGNLNKIPTSYELCDGERVATPGSPILGAKKPNLVDRFIKGAVDGVSNVTEKPEENTQHIKDISHSHSAGSSLRALIGIGSTIRENTGIISWIPRGGTIETRILPPRTNQVTTTYPQSSGGPAESGVAIEGDTEKANLTVDVRPKFVSLFYIIKVR